MTQFTEKQATVVVPKGYSLKDVIDFDNGVMDGEEPISERVVEVVYE